MEPHTWLNVLRVLGVRITGMPDEFLNLARGVQNKWDVASSNR
jgi:hypothetical protein